MFTLNDSDLDMFKRYCAMVKAVRDPRQQLSAEEFTNTAQNIFPVHHQAYLFSSGIIGPEIDINNKKHQHVLGLALSAQRDPTTWREYEVQDQRILFELYGLKYNSDKRQQESFINKYIKPVFGHSLDVVGTVCPEPKVAIASSILSSLLNGISILKKSPEGMGRKVIENLDKLDPAYILESGILLDPEAQQFITTKNTHSLSEMQMVLEKYGVMLKDLNSMTKLQGNELRQLFEGFVRKEQQVQHLQSEREKYLKRMQDGRELFQGIGQLANVVSDPKLQRNLQLVSFIGGQGLGIASKAMELGGLIPGMAAPTGIGMLFPMASIAITAATIIFSLSKKDDDQKSPMEELFNAMRVLSQQIESLRKEMHARFDQIDEKLNKIYQNLSEALHRLQVLIGSELNLLKSTLQISLDRIQEDIDELTKITENGFKDQLLTQYKDHIFTPLQFYIDEPEIAPALDYTLINTLEKNWLLGNFCQGIFSGRYYRPDQTFHQIFSIVNKNEELILGYLARFAAEKLQIKGIKDVDLPSLDLWLEGVLLALSARICYKTRNKDNKNFPIATLQKIFKKAKNTLDFIDTLTHCAQELFDALFAINCDGVSAFGKKAVELISAQEKMNMPRDEEVVTAVELVQGAGKKQEKKIIKEKISMVTLDKIELDNISPTPAQAGEKLSVLEATHFKKKMKKYKVPAILLVAQDLGLGCFLASYTASKSGAQGFHDGTFGRGYPCYGIPPAPTYKIKLIFRLNSGKEIVLLNVSFQYSPARKDIGWDHCTVSANSPTCNVYRRKEDGRPLSEVATSDSWEKSAITGEVDWDHRFFKKVKKHFPSIEDMVEKTWKKVTAADVKKTKEHDAFLVKIEALKARKELFTPMIDQFKATKALAIAYGRLTGVDEKTLSEMTEIEFSFGSQMMLREKFNEFGEQSCANVDSRVKLKLLKIFQSLKVFETQFLSEGALFGKDVVPPANSSSPSFPFSLGQGMDHGKQGNPPSNVHGLLQGIHPIDKSIIAFNEFEVKGDGNCGFYSLGISRDKCMQELLACASSDAVRNELSEELINEIKSGNIAPGTFSGATLTEAKELSESWQKLLIEESELDVYLNAQINQLTPGLPRIGIAKSKELKELLSSDNKYKELLEKLESFVKKYNDLNAKIHNFCKKEETYKNYVNQLGQANGGWLGKRGAILLAKRMHFNLYIWHRESSGSTKLACEIHHIESPKVEKTYHLLHTNRGTHFNLLAELPARSAQLENSSLSSILLGSLVHFSPQYEAYKASIGAKTKSPSEDPNKAGLGLS